MVPGRVESLWTLGKEHFEHFLRGKRIQFLAREECSCGSLKCTFQSFLRIEMRSIQTSSGFKLATWRGILTLNNVDFQALQHKPQRATNA